MNLYVGECEAYFSFDCVLLTVEEVRSNDPALRAYAASDHPYLEVPLGLAGEYCIHPTVMDKDCDYFLPEVSIAITPDMTPLDVARLIVQHWTAFPIMDDFAVADLHSAHLYSECPPQTLGITLYAQPGRVLTDEELQQMP